jgi:hypothetical protein
MAWHGARGCNLTCVLCSALNRFVGCWAVGTVLGAITGGLIGLATETGVVRGTGVGGLTGALVSMEVVESYLAIWRSDEPAIWSAVYVVSACSARFSLAWPRRHGCGDRSKAKIRRGRGSDARFFALF